MGLRYDGTNWIELWRTPQRTRDLVTTDLEDRNVYTPITLHVPTTPLAAGVQVVYHYFEQACTIKNIAAHVVDAPSGGSCVVDFQDDTVSIFSGEGEMAIITDGNNSAISNTKDHAVAAGSWGRIEVKNTADSPNSADHLSVTLNVYSNLQTAP